MIKCIACDLDGTLIKSDDQIVKEVLDKLYLKQKKGIEFLIVTGRDYNMVIDIVDKYQLNCDLILNNGAEYREKDRQKMLIPMDDEAFIKIAHTLHNKGYLLSIHTSNGKYALYSQDEFWDKHMELLKNGLYKGRDLPKKTFTIKEAYCRDFHYVTSPEEIIKQNIKVLKIDARHGNKEEVKGIRELIDTSKIAISCSYEDNMEITSNQTNKAHMLKKVCKLKGYEIDEVAVFGDGDNDIEMLSTFPYSFAPNNATEFVKEKAHYQLTQTNEEKAVLEGIMLLQEKQLL